MLSGNGVNGSSGDVGINNGSGNGGVIGGEGGSSKAGQVRSGQGRDKTLLSDEKLK